MIPLDYFLSVLPGTVVKVLLSGRWYSLEGTLSRLQSHASVCYRHHHSHHVENVAKKLRGSAGLGGLDANNLSQHLLRYKDTREDLHHEVAELTMWFPSWSSYRALMSGRFIALDNNPGVRPTGIGESWRRLFAKCLLSVAGKEAAEECGIDNLSGGMSAGIKAAVHSAKWYAATPIQMIGFSS